MDKDIAVLQTEFKNLHESQRNQTDMLKEIMTQTKRTNGRVGLIEERHRIEDQQGIPKRLASLEKWKYGVMAVCTLVLLVGYKVITWSFDGMLRDSLQEHALEYEKDIDEKIEASIKKVLAGYEFNITE